MQKVAFNLGQVELSVQGLDRMVNPEEFAPIALEAMFAYGVRRWFQDHVNGQAHIYREAAKAAAAKGETFNNGEAFDAAACFAARLEAAKSGILSPARSNAAAPAFSEQEEAVYAVAFENRNLPKFAAIAGALKAAKGLTTDERKAMVLKAVAALPDAARNALTRIASDRVAAAAALRELDL